MRRIVFPMVLVLTAWLGASLVKGQTTAKAVYSASQTDSETHQGTPLKTSYRLPDGGYLQLQPPKSAHPPFVHTVVVYLKKDTPPAKVETLIRDCHNILAKIPSVRHLWVGRPSDKSTGNSVVKDYSVSLLLLFDNYEGLKAYEDDFAHHKFVETYFSIVEKLQVYDFLNQTK